MADAPNDPDHRLLLHEDFYLRRPIHLSRELVHPLIYHRDLSAQFTPLFHRRLFIGIRQHNSWPLSIDGAHDHMIWQLMWQSVHGILADALSGSLAFWLRRLLWRFHVDIQLHHQRSLLPRPFFEGRHGQSNRCQIHCMPPGSSSPGFSILAQLEFATAWKPADGMMGGRPRRVPTMPSEHPLASSSMARAYAKNASRFPATNAATHADTTPDATENDALEFWAAIICAEDFVHELFSTRSPTTLCAEEFIFQRCVGLSLQIPRLRHFHLFMATRTQRERLLSMIFPVVKSEGGGESRGRGAAGPCCRPPGARGCGRP